MEMDEPVKARPGRRERKTVATRHGVLGAAETLFLRDGYAATTMAAIAEAADVAVQTVYAVFGTKRAILTQPLEVRVVADDRRTALQDREEWQAIERESDPGRQLALLAALAAQIGTRVAALYEVIAAAAGADPDIAALYRHQQQARYTDQHRLAQALAGKQALRVGLSEARATDILWTLANPRTYHSLVGERRWTSDEYERWLGHLLACALLAKPPT
jgi:AcrR family transcriptional regulator